MNTIITVNEVEVTINWEDRSGGSVGEAVHSVSETDLDEGGPRGPYDGHNFTLDGKKYKLGQHEYEPDDGWVTCSAEVYEVAE